MATTAIMNESINGAEKVFDELERRGEAWNVYQYMVKLASEAVAKVVLGMEFHHFTEVDAPLHPMVIGIADALSLNKKIASKGELYAKLPFGDPKKLHDLMEWQVRIPICLSDCLRRLRCLCLAFVLGEYSLTCLSRHQLVRANRESHP